MEMKNEGHRAAKYKIEDSRSKYTDLYDFAPVGYFTLDENGLILEVNLTGAELLWIERASLIKKAFAGFVHKDDQDIFLLHSREVIEKKKRHSCEIRINRKDGSEFHAKLDCVPVQDIEGNCTQLRATISDITGRKKTEEVLHLFNRLLEISNRHMDMSLLLNKFMNEIRNFTKCSAVGIRLLDKDGNIPYTAYDGFKRKRIEAESPISVKSDRCMCINVIKRNIDPKLSYFTGNGSFYSNSAAKLLAAIAEKDMGKVRKACNLEGYESVALVPIMSEGNVLGLIHVADAKENFIPVETVNIIEKAAIQLGTAIDRVKIENDLHDALYKSQRREAKISALLKSSRSILESPNFSNAARLIFDSCKNIIGAAAGYVALLSNDSTENEVLFFDAGGLPCSVDPDLPMRIRGLRAEAYRRGRAVYHNDFSNSKWTKYMPPGHVALKNVLFAPLAIEHKVVGVIGLANKPSDFTENDVRMANAFAELASIALHNSRNLELLENSEECFRSVAETANDAIISISSQGNIFFWNKGAENIFGYHADETLGMPITIIIPATLHSAHIEGITRVVSTDKSKMIGKTVEIVGMRKNGSTFPLELSLSKWSTREGTFFTGIIRDVTERNQIEKELIKHRLHLMELVAERTLELRKVNEELEQEISERKKAEAETLRARHLASIGELAAGVAHEINNPINGIINYAQILFNKSKLRSKENDISSRIINEGDRIANIVRSLLSFARDNINKNCPSYFHEIMNDTLTLTKAQLKKDGIKLHIADLNHLPKVNVQPQQIEQVFLNIISNARYALNQKYPGLHKDKILEITGERVLIKNKPFVRISFYDCGTGIPDKIKDKIMDPFFTTKPAAKGTGLGLSISHGIISDHGGTLSIDSIEGEFTKLTVELPINN